MSAQEIPSIGPMINHVLAWAEKGLKLIPLHPTKRTPYFLRYHDLATTDPDQLRRWWAKWPEAIIGCVLDDDVIILDVDPKHNGMSTWEALGGDDIVVERRHFSGRNDGGHHNWFVKPDVPEGQRLRISGMNKWAQTIGTGEAAGEAGWVCGIDLITSRHRYTILPPSPHPVTGKPYFLDRDRRGAPGPLPEHLAALLLEGVPEPKLRDAALPSSVEMGETPADWVTRTMTWAEILEPHTWACVWGDGEEDGSLWRHPTATSASSASVRYGLLFVYSPNTPFEVTQPSEPHGYTPFKAWALLEFAGDESRAASAARERMNVVQGVKSKAPAPSVEAPELNLPAEFWETNDILRDVRDAAWAQMCSPDAVLGALLVRYAAVVHPSIVLPGLGSLDLFTVCVGHSGAGKSQAAKTARMLFPGTDKRGVLLDLPVGSGEGLTEKFFRFEDEDGKPCSPQKKGAQKVQWLNGLHFTADEGMALAAQAGRMGSTLIPTLCAAWMGETLGQTNASVATSRSIGPNKARLTAQINIQTVNGHKLFSEEYSATGLAQRMLCVHAQDPSIAEPSWSPPAMPAPLQLPLPPTSGGLRTLEVAPEILEEISASRRAAHSPTWNGDPLDTHQLLVQLKLAALLSLMSGHPGVALDWWGPSALIFSTHRSLRSLLQQSAVTESLQQGDLRIKSEVAKALAVRNAVHTNDVHQTIEYFRKRIAAGLSIASGDIAAGRREHRDEALEVLALEPGSRLERTSEGWRVGVA